VIVSDERTAPRVRSLGPGHRTRASREGSSAGVRRRTPRTRCGPRRAGRRPAGFRTNNEAINHWSSTPRCSTRSRHPGFILPSPSLAPEPRTHPACPAHQQLTSSETGDPTSKMEAAPATTGRRLECQHGARPADQTGCGHLGASTLRSKARYSSRKQKRLGNYELVLDTPALTKNSALSIIPEPGRHASAPGGIRQRETPRRRPPFVQRGGLAATRPESRIARNPSTRRSKC
jgi:hypothetical protein